MQFAKSSVGVLIAGIFSLPATGDAQTPSITLHYYSAAEAETDSTDRQSKGENAQLAAEVFEHAGIPFTWHETPPLRIFSIMKENLGFDCSSGWYKTKEREEFAVYSLPLSIGSRIIGLMLKKSARAHDGITAKELFAEPGLRYVSRSGLAWGEYLDRLIAQIPPQNAEYLSADQSALVKMIHNGRADLTIMAESEVPILVAKAGLDLADFRIVRFAEMREMPRSYIICSKLVPASLIERINQAIREMSKNQPE